MIDMRLSRPDGTISKLWILAFVLGLPAAITALLVGAPTIGPWLVGAGAIVAVAAAVAAGRSARDEGSGFHSANGVSDSTPPDSSSGYGGGSDGGGGDGGSS
jgi:hypothetical protein